MKTKMIFLLLIVFSLSACSNGSNDEPMGYHVDEAVWEDSDEMMWEEAGEAMWNNADSFDSEYFSFRAISEDFDDIGGEEMLRANTPLPRSENTGSPTIVSDRVIHRADIGIVVDDFDEGILQVQELTADFAGFIELSRITGESSSSLGRVGDFTIRIPSDSFDEMLSMLADLGDFNFLNTTATNVSDRYSDIVSRLNSLRTQEERVLELVESAEDLADLLLLEGRLGDLIYEIELLTGERNHLDNQIAYSTIDVVITEYVEAFSSGANAQPVGDVFMTSLQALGAFGGFLIRAVVALIPWLIPSGIVFLLLRMIWRRRKG